MIINKTLVRRFFSLNKLADLDWMTQREDADCLQSTIQLNASAMNFNSTLRSPSPQLYRCTFTIYNKTLIIFIIGPNFLLKGPYPY